MTQDTHSCHGVTLETTLEVHGAKEELGQRRPVWTRRKIRAHRTRDTGCEDHRSAVCVGTLGLRGSQAAAFTG